MSRCRSNLLCDQLTLTWRVRGQALPQPLNAPPVPASFSAVASKRPLARRLPHAHITPSNVCPNRRQSVGLAPRARARVLPDGNSALGQKTTKTTTVTVSRRTRIDRNRVLINFYIRGPSPTNICSASLSLQTEGRTVHSPFRETLQQRLGHENGEPPPLLQAALVRGPGSRLQQPQREHRPACEEAADRPSCRRGDFSPPPARFLGPII